MNRISATVAKIWELLDANAASEAHSRLDALISSIGRERTPADAQLILGVIQRFHHKRHRDLRAHFVRQFGAEMAKLSPIVPEPIVSKSDTSKRPSQLNPESYQTTRHETEGSLEAVVSERSQTPSVEAPDTIAMISERLRDDALRNGNRGDRRNDAFRKALRTRLHQLSEQHIFKWTTFYRDYFAGELFPSVLAIAKESPGALASIVEVLGEEVAHHATEIFEKGYGFTIGTKMGGHQYAMNKSVSGLQRFLELPLELYSSALRGIPSSVSATTVRIACSSMIRGILCGYGTAKLGHETGGRVLPVRQRAWVHYVAFLTHNQLVATLEQLEPGQLVDNLTETVLPTVGGLDRLASPDATATAPALLPILGQYDWPARRLDITIRAVALMSDPRPFELQCYLDPAYVSVPSLEEADHRGVAVLVAPLKADVEEWVRTRPSLATRLVDVSHHAPVEAESQIVSTAQAVVSRRYDPGAAGGTLTYNFAKDFPLKSAQLPRYYYIYRRSVRNLLRTFERRTGIRIWCSVRRSGKTTACWDVGATGVDSTVITQTCQDTEGRQDATLLYKEVTKAIASSTRISDDFLTEIIESSGPGRRLGEGRFVLMLDEYEVLFGDLRTAVASSEAIKYRVALPLLNQLVQFSRENLLIFIGQEPDAHLILMDRNQLSAYVEQDGFPLFSGLDEGEGSEFSALVRKVITDRVSLERECEVLLFRETGGHPFLTVNVLVEFMEWLIDRRIPAQTRALMAEDFVTFCAERLSQRRLVESAEYDFFRGAAGEALGSLGRRRSPWLHSQYMIMRLLATESPDTLTMSRGDLDNLLLRKGSDRSSRFSVAELLGTGARANFLEVEGELVRPRIPILARLTSIVVPGA